MRGGVVRVKRRLLFPYRESFIKMSIEKSEIGIGEVKEQREDHHLWKGMLPKTSWTYSNVFSFGGSSAEMDCS
jgi:hypothetical protein